MKLLAMLGIAYAVSAVLVAQSIITLPATNLDINAALVQQLKAQLAQSQAESVGLRADVAVCQANAEQAKREYQSLVLTSDVQKAIESLKSTMGGDWVWDNDKRRVVPAKKAADTPQESK